MPFDGSEQFVIPYVLSLDGLIEWLEKQPKKTTYQYENPRDCLLCRYLRDNGVNATIVSPTSYFKDGKFIPFPDARLNTASRQRGGPLTYEAALIRAKALKESA